MRGEEARLWALALRRPWAAGEDMGASAEVGCGKTGAEGRCVECSTQDTEGSLDPGIWSHRGGWSGGREPGFTLRS